MSRKFLALCRKELLLLLRDRHGLLVLFAMPAGFILVMSLALRGAFDARSAPDVTLAVDDRDGAPLSQQFIERVEAGGTFRPAAGEPMVRLVIESGFSELLATRYDFADDYRGGEKEPQLLQIAFSPTLPLQMRAAVRLAIAQALIAVQTEYLLGTVMERPASEVARIRYLSDPARVPIAQTVTVAGARIPNAVQQSVPAWLIFALFFTVVPLATTFVIEREQGSLLRLRVLDVSGTLLFASKLVPYYVVNLAQTALMLAIGVYLVPALGGDALSLGDARWTALLLIASATSVAAIALAMLVAVNVRSILQATAVGGALCLLLGALGGIMVPKFIMPASMQALTAVSPMAWALEGWWDVLLRKGDASAVLPECAALIALAGLCLGAAAACYRTRTFEQS